MVFFNCNACGEALKKSAVEKHYLTKCRQCEVLSCVDCGKDFWGNDYQQHVKCISEEEKYSGKDYKPKANQNKGEKKQEQWIQQVQEAVQKASGNSSLRSILQKLVDYPNIPRKQAKFENFLKNSLRIHNTNLSKQVWDAMSASMNKPVESQTNGNDKAKTENGDKSEKSDAKSSENDSSQNETESAKPKNKRERKEERREKASKKQKKDKNPENGEKKRKRKHEEAEQEDEEVVVKKSKKKKKSHVEEEVEPEVENEEEEEEEEPTPVALTPGKFRWEATIVSVLRKQDDKELALKKLRKKVLNEYFSLVAEKNRLSEEQLWAKFDKKVTKNGQFKVHKERVKLVK